MMCTGLPRIVISPLESVQFRDSSRFLEQADTPPIVKFVTIIEAGGRRFEIDWIHETGGKAVDLDSLDDVWLDLKAVL